MHISHVAGDVGAMERVISGPGLLHGSIAPFFLTSQVVGYDVERRL